MCLLSHQKSQNRFYSVLGNKQLPNSEAQGALEIVLKHEKWLSTKETGDTGSGGRVRQSYQCDSYLTSTVWSQERRDKPLS